jgi:hypothetical protein
MAYYLYNKIESGKTTHNTEVQSQILLLVRYVFSRKISRHSLDATPPRRHHPSQSQRRTQDLGNHQYGHAE